MPYDILNAVAPRLNDGALMQLLDPAGNPIFDDQGQPVGVYMRGRNSSAGLAALRANGNRRLEMARRGGTTISVENGETELTEVLVACTTGWTFDSLGGESFTYSPENARRLWSDDRFRRWRLQADDFISTEANFMKG